MPSTRATTVALALCLVLAGCLAATPTADPSTTDGSATATTDDSTPVTAATTDVPNSATTPTATDEPPTASGPARTWTPSPLGPALSACAVPEPVSPTPTTEPGTPSGTGDLSAGLEVTSNFDGNLTVILRRLPQNVTTFARRYPADESYVNLGPEMADKSDYWTVVVADCEVVWSRPVRDYQALSIRIDEGGNVTVEQVVEA